MQTCSPIQESPENYPENGRNPGTGGSYSTPECIDIDSDGDYE